MTRTIVMAGAAVLLTAAGLLTVHAAQGTTKTPMSALAERYVKLVLALGQHNQDYVDAYYGRPSGSRRSRPAS
jgi:hypothetical protein